MFNRFNPFINISSNILLPRYNSAIGGPLMQIGYDNNLDYWHSLQKWFSPSGKLSRTFCCPLRQNLSQCFPKCFLLDSDSLLWMTRVEPRSQVVPQTTAWILLQYEWEIYHWRNELADDLQSEHESNRSFANTLRTQMSFLSPIPILSLISILLGKLQSSFGMFWIV